MKILTVARMGRITTLKIQRTTKTRMKDTSMMILIMTFFKRKMMIAVKRISMMKLIA